MTQRLMTLVLVLAIAGLLAWALWPRPVPQATAQVGRQTLSVVIEEEGRTRIRDIYTVSAPISGKMQRSLLEPGDEVIEDMTVVAMLQPADPGLLDARARRVAEAAAGAAQAAVSLAEAQLKEAQSTSVYAESEFERAATLVRRGTISERTFDKAKLDAATARAQLASAEANLEVRRRELESANAVLIQGSGIHPSGECCVPVKAPASGRVLRVLVKSEQTVQAGMPLAEIGDPRDLEIEVELLSRDAVRVASGAKATIDGWGGPQLDAHVERIDPSAVTKVSALGIEEQRVNAVLRLDGDPARWARLGHGFRVVVHIEVWRNDDALAVPLGALFRKGSEWAVYAVENGRAKLKTVSIGERNSLHGEVLGGLQEGEIVILHPSDRVEDGVAIAAE